MVAADMSGAGAWARSAKHTLCARDVPTVLASSLCAASACLFSGIAWVFGHGCSLSGSFHNPWQYWRPVQRQVS